MERLLLVVGTGLVAWWGVLTLWLDRPSVPAWQARNAYRLLAVGLTLLVFLISYKAALYRQELRFQIELCR